MNNQNIFVLGKSIICLLSEEGGVNVPGWRLTCHLLHYGTKYI